MNADTEARLAYLADSVDLLWPAGDGPDRVVLPTAAHPRVLVPRRPWRATVATLARYTAQQRVRDQAMALAVALAFGMRVLRPSPVVATAGMAGESIDDLLGDILGERVRTSLALTHARPNRKPVLQVFNRRGRTIAFTKVGVTPLARKLVDDEAQSLKILADANPRELHVPEVIGHREWRDTTVLVTTALPLGRPVPRAEIAPETALARAMHEVSHINGGRNISGYLDVLRVRAGALPHGAEEWLEMIELAEASLDGDVPTGSWHGDWTQWNCARSRDGSPLLVWDWERFAGPAPAGFDMLHYLMNDIVTAGRGKYLLASRQLVHRAPTLLRDWPMAATTARRVAGLYVLDIGLRYRTDGTVQDVEDWVFPVVRANLTGKPRGAAR